MHAKSVGAMILAAFITLTLGCGPFDDDDVVVEEVLCRVEVLEVPDSTDSGGTIVAHIAGIVGPNACYGLDRIERERHGTKWVLRPVAHHVIGRGVCCPQMIVLFDEIVELGYADSGWVYVEARTLGPLLIDSTYVRPPPPPVDTLNYTCYYMGLPAVTGWFTMKATERGKIAGEWHFSYVGEPVDVGPQVGDGSLIGTVQGDHVEISLNPGWRDANVDLDGTMTGDLYAGEWTYTTFVGIRSYGPFEATRK